MNRLLLATIACASVMSPGFLFAADLPVKAPPPVVTWTGFYAGLGLGFRSTTVDSRTIRVTEDGIPDTCPFSAGNACFFSVPLNDTGFRFSLYGGYNWQVNSAVVLGIEADGGWARKTTTLFGTALPGGPFIMSGFNTDSISVRPDWDASLRLRAGYLVTPAFLIYAT